MSTAHIHSTYSDGEFTMAELRDLFLAEDCAFVCMTDHAEYFNTETIKEYVEDCHAHSDERSCFVPGLEYECDNRVHILGYGARRLASSVNPQEVIRHSEAQGAISIIAHPTDAFFDGSRTSKLCPKALRPGIPSTTAATLLGRARSNC